AKFNAQRRDRQRERMLDPKYVACKREKAREKYARDPMVRERIRVDGVNRKIQRQTERLESLAGRTCKNEACRAPLPADRVDRRYMSTTCRKAVVYRLSQEKRQALSPPPPPPKTEEERQRLKEERRARENEQRRERMQDPEYRAKVKERARQRHQNTEYRAR